MLRIGPAPARESYLVVSLLVPEAEFAVGVDAEREVDGAGVELLVVAGLRDDLPVVGRARHEARGDRKARQADYLGTDGRSSHKSSCIAVVDVSEAGPEI